MPAAAVLAAGWFDHEPWLEWLTVPVGVLAAVVAATAVVAVFAVAVASAGVSGAGTGRAVGRCSVSRLWPVGMAPRGPIMSSVAMLFAGIITHDSMLWCRPQ
ncbi:hypothetical protein FrCorBMG51_20580 [Protofrankia coriariae]|uniref:Uncharacterized protein n=1 Tax=Protofrankia coriariae TaxID=1562887 RepID=A0ABR5EZZ0_9ACTN|nr:hypothetical protein FrCorBMG51_20580 [Protofrankia coriariae]